MKKGRFLWSAYRITEKQKAGKAQNIKEKQLQNSRRRGAGQPAGHGHDGKKEEDADEKKEGTGAEGGGGKKE